MNTRERKAVAIIQSSYIPWKGYFDIIGSVDEFILYDDTQFTRRDWRNRNRIKTASGLQWLTIPVKTKGRYTQPICETEVENREWARKHFRSIESSYRRAAHFAEYAGKIAALYEMAGDLRVLSDINELFLRGLCEILGIGARITQSTCYGGDGAKTDRLLSICRTAGAAIYLSGPSAKSYIDPDRFAENGIVLRYMDYAGYPPYRQLFGEFEHQVSALDLLFNEGPAARNFMKAPLDFSVLDGR